MSDNGPGYVSNTFAMACLVLWLALTSALGLSARRGCGGNAEALPPIAPWLVPGSLFPWGISVVRWGH